MNDGYSEGRNGRTGIPRRRFLRYAFLGALAGLLVETAAAFVAFFRPRKVGAFGSQVVAGRVEDFPVGSVTRVLEGRFYVAHVPEGFLALWQKCPHLGCTVPWVPDEPSEDGVAAQGRFNCPCHSSIYDRYGLVKAGPAPRPLDLFPVAIVEGKVVVDTNPSGVRQREGWDPSQAVKA